MKIILEFLLIVLLLLIFYQDLKDRKVSLWLLIFGILVGVSNHYHNHFFSIFLLNISINVVFVILIFSFITFYTKIKLKEKIFNVFGEGDLLFFFLLAVSFPIFSFLIIFIFSLIFSLIVYRFVIRKNKKQTVPLAGLQSVFLVVILLVDNLFLTLDIFLL